MLRRSIFRYYLNFKDRILIARGRRFAWQPVDSGFVVFAAAPAKFSQMKLLLTLRTQASYFVPKFADPCRSGGIFALLWRRWLDRPEAAAWSMAGPREETQGLSRHGGHVSSAKSGRSAERSSLCPVLL